MDPRRLLTGYWSVVFGGVERRTSPATWAQVNEEGRPELTDFWDAEARHRRCVRDVEEAFKDRHVQFLAEALRKLGRDVGPGMVRCVGAGATQTLSGKGGYVWETLPSADLSKGEIALSENDCVGVPAIRQSLRHELIHAYDDARAVVDPTNCFQHACSEIRASRLSGECLLKEEMLRGKVALFDSIHHAGKRCVRRRAALSVEQNPTCKGRGNQAVEASWDACFPDSAPYLRFPVDVIGK
eukprot:Sspe_Gene.103143::Locus_78963_Transcript_1_1_Confidence_1.000_Length_887::g.103143::m.103143/K18156/ATP23, XRCC6BP1; mitochondrial inner membrane protease ATP23